MTSINLPTPITPQSHPSLAPLLADLTQHRETAQDMLRHTDPVTHQGTLVQSALAHAVTGLLLFFEADAVVHVAEAAAREQVQDDAPPRERTSARVRVFHNNPGRDVLASGYRDGQSVTEVYAYTETGLRPDTDDLRLAERAFELFNVGDDPERGTPDPRAVEYRSRGNRSLSVGDVLAVDGRFFSCDSVGWRELDHQPRIQQQRQHGTTPLYLASTRSRSKLVHLDFFADPIDPDAKFYARRDCPSCHGQGLIEVPSRAVGDTDTCSCVLRGRNRRSRDAQPA